MYVICSSYLFAVGTLLGLSSRQRYTLFHNPPIVMKFALEVWLPGNISQLSNPIISLSCYFNMYI